MTRHNDVLLAVSTATGYGLGDLRGPRRYGQIVRARFAAAWLLRVLCGLSYPQIGLALGGRDHQTAINAVRRVDRDIRDDGPLAHYLVEVIGAMALGFSIRDMDMLRSEAFA